MIPTITVMAESEPVTLSFEHLALYHGQSALAMLAVTFQGLRHGLAAVSPEGPAQRAGIRIVSGHPGPGVRDAFEMVTRAVTREAYVIDRTLPLARLNRHLPISYSFELGYRDREVTVALREGVLPDRFFDLVGQSAAGTLTPATSAEFAALKARLAVEVLRQSPEAIVSLSTDS